MVVLKANVGDLNLLKVKRNLQIKINENNLNKWPFASVISSKDKFLFGQFIAVFTW